MKLTPNSLSNLRTLVPKSNCNLEVLIFEKGVKPGFH